MATLIKLRLSRFSRWCGGKTERLKHFCVCYRLPCPIHFRVLCGNGWGTNEIQVYTIPENALSRHFPQEEPTCAMPETPRERDNRLIARLLPAARFSGPLFGLHLARDTPSSCLPRKSRQQPIFTGPDELLLSKLCLPHSRGQWLKGGSCSPGDHAIGNQITDS